MNEGENFHVAHTLQIRRLDFVNSIIKQHNFAKCALLDIGCAEGDFLLNAKNSRRFEELIGIDLDPQILEIAQESLCQITNFDLNQLKTAHQWYLKLGV